MTASQVVQNFPLKSLATAYNMGKIDSSINLGYAINTDGDTNYFTLPYSTANVISQKFASRTVNINPFSFSVRDGYISLSPNVDTWVDTNYSPALLVVDPDLQVYQASQNVNQMTNGDWKTIPGTQYTTVKYVEGHGINPSPFGYVGYKETSTYGSQSQTNTFGAFDKVGTYALNNNYVTDVSILPWMRPQQIVSRAKGMLFNTSVNYFFDGTNVNNYIRKGNIIELTSVTGTFKEGDIIGYYASGSFTPTARVMGIFVGTSGTRLYVAADQHSATYTTNGTIQNGFFNAAGAYTSTTASGTVASSIHFGGRIINAANTTTIQLSPLASSANSYYNSNTFYVCAGTGAGQSANIAAYNGVTKTITLSTE
jgi:heptaprenylglyceryl phosphate synthase